MSKQPRRLGRGLASVVGVGITDGHGISTAGLQIPETVPALSNSPERQRIMRIPVNKIRPNPSQPRRAFPEDGLRGLAQSIRDRGALQPILVRPAGNGYELIAGERRLRASMLAGLPDIPAIVRSTSDEDMLELALIENIQRSDLNPIERARAYQALSDKRGLSHEEIADRMGEDRATVTNYIRLLGLCDRAVEMLGEGTISTGHAKALLGLADPRLQASYAERVVGQGWSVRQLESSIRLEKTRKAGSGTAEKPKARPVVSDAAGRLSEALGTRVSIKEGRRRHSGRITIEYYTLDEFQRITALLGLAGE